LRFGIFLQRNPNLTRENFWQFGAAEFVTQTQPKSGSAASLMAEKFRLFRGKVNRFGVYSRWRFV